MARESILGSSRNRAGYSFLTIAAQEPEGVTMYPSPAKADRNFRAIFRASFRFPELNAGWPQQVCDRGTRTSAPKRSRTETVAKQTRGKKASARQVKKRETGMGRFSAILKVYGKGIPPASGKAARKEGVGVSGPPIGQDMGIGVT